MTIPKDGTKEYWQAVTDLSEKIGDRLEGASRVETRLMGIEVLPRLMLCLKSNEEHCSKCRRSLVLLEEQLNNIREVVNPDNKEVQAEFEKISDSILLHLQSEHKIYPRGKVYSRVVTVCVVLGLVIGGGLHFAMGSKSFMSALMTGLFLGLVIGYVGGKLVEWRMKSKNQLF